MKIEKRSIMFLLVAAVALAAVVAAALQLGFLEVSVKLAKPAAEASLAALEYEAAPYQTVYIVQEGSIFDLPAQAGYIKQYSDTVEYTFRAVADGLEDYNITIYITRSPINTGGLWGEVVAEAGLTPGSPEAAVKVYKGQASEIQGDTAIFYIHVYGYIKSSNETGKLRITIEAQSLP